MTRKRQQSRVYPDASSHPDSCRRAQTNPWQGSNPPVPSASSPAQRTEPPGARCCDTPGGPFSYLPPDLRLLASVRHARPPVGSESLLPLVRTPARRTSPEASVERCPVHRVATTEPGSRKSRCRISGVDDDVNAEVASGEAGDRAVHPIAARPTVRDVDLIDRRR